MLKLCFGRTSERKPGVFFDLTRDTEYLGRVVFVLYPQVAPMAVENFRMLCTGFEDENGIERCYKGTTFHLLIKNFMIQGGDIVDSSGKNNYSKFKKLIKDEKSLTHEKSGMLGLANQGPDSNGSQFYVTLATCLHLDGQTTAIGRVVEGLEIFWKIADETETKDDKPLSKIIIEHCDELTSKEEANVDINLRIDPYPPYPEDCDIFRTRNVSVNEFWNMCTGFRTSALKLLEQKKYYMARNMFYKSMRYTEFYGRLSKKGWHQDQTDSVFKSCFALLRMESDCENWEQAVEAAHFVNDYTKADVVGLLKRGDAYAALNKTKLALQDYNTFVKKYPDKMHVVADRIKECKRRR